MPPDERRIRMLRQNVTHEQAREWEKFYIQKFGRVDVGNGRAMLQNRTSGGDGTAGLRQRPQHTAKIREANRGKRRSSETKARISAVSGNRSAEIKAKIASTLQGRKLSDTHKASISASLRGRKISEEQRVSMREKRIALPAEEKAKFAAAKVRNSALRIGVDPDVWSSLSKDQRRNANARAKQQGLTTAQYLEKMRVKWGL